MVEYSVSEELERQRQQFNQAPFPRIPLEQSPKGELDTLYIHNLITPFYLRNQVVIETANKVILDAGCGTGYTSLMLAEANPGAKIIGVDISEESVKLAEQRLRYHGVEQAEFHAMPLEDLPQLGLQFDFINCDEVLYLLPDPLAGLQAMQSVLQPDGIMRLNLHSALQRMLFFRFQEIFDSLGLMNGPIQDLEMSLAREFVHALRDDTFLKISAWKPQFEHDDERLLANCMLQGDKGFTIPDIFEMLEATGLEFISMLRWREWDLTSLFKDPQNLPPFLAMSLPEATEADRLHLYELLNPIHRLIDFWCGQAGQTQAAIPVFEWTETDWRAAHVQLHPQLHNDGVKAYLIECLQQRQPFDLTRVLSAPAVTPVVVDSALAACLLPLWEGRQPVQVLVDRWLKVRPLDPLTLASISPEQAWNDVTQLLSRLEVYLYVLLERPDSAESP